jgi:hypothetical protein
VVAAALVEAMESLKLEVPKVDAAGLAEMEKARAALIAEEPARPPNRK